jgi:hypothetical protein
MAEVLNEYNLVDLSKGVMRALGQIAPSALSPADLDKLQAKVDKLLALIPVVYEDHQKASKFLMGISGPPPLNQGPLEGYRGSQEDHHCQWG